MRCEPHALPCLREPMSPGVLTSLLAQAPPDEGWIGNWSPGIGDPTFVGWFTVLAYVVAAALCWRDYRRLADSTTRGFEGHLASVLPLILALFVSKRRMLTLPERQRVAALWLGLAIALLALGVNKQLDLQTALTEIGRMLARDEGWYAVRRKVQAAFIVVVAVTGLWLFRALVNVAAGARGHLKQVLAGTVFIIVFVIIRATSFHHIDTLLGVRLEGFTLNWIIELGGIAFILVGAYREGRVAPPLPMKRKVPTGRASGRTARPG